MSLGRPDLDLTYFQLKSIVITFLHFTNGRPIPLEKNFTLHPPSIHTQLIKRCFPLLLLWAHSKILPLYCSTGENGSRRQFLLTFCKGGNSNCYCYIICQLQLSERKQPPLYKIKVGNHFFPLSVTRYPQPFNLSQTTGLYCNLLTVCVCVCWGGGGGGGCLVPVCVCRHDTISTDCSILWCLFFWCVF